MNLKIVFTDKEITPWSGMPACRRQGFHEEIAGSDRDSIEANFQ